MADPEAEEKSLYAEFRAGIEGDPLIRSLRIAVFVLFAIQTVFIFVDWLVYPEMFVRFLPVRMGLNAVLGIIYFGTCTRYPLASSFATYFAGGAMLLTVIQGTGGGSSSYYVGLVLLFIGIGVLSPLSGRQAALGTGVLYAAYAAGPFLGDEPIQWSRFGLHLFFLGAAGFEGVMSCVLLDRMRFSDFKRRREVEQARDELKKLDEEKSRFTANIHHELRTPLTLTLAPLEAMIGGEFGSVSELQAGYLRTMHSNGLRLLKLINNLLDLAKIEGKQLQISRRPTRVKTLIEGLVNGARPLAERKGVGLESVGGEDLPLVNVDPEAIEKVIVNLVGNSLKFTERGDRIEVSATPEEGGVHLVVSDTGLGIPPEQLGRIFDRFAQVDGSSTRRHEGTGIGLALVKELVELHEGRIWAESEGEGHGSRMHVVLPVGEADDEAQEDVIQTSTGDSVALANSFEAMQDETAMEGPGSESLKLVELERTVQRAEGVVAATSSDAPNEGVAADAAEVLIVEDNTDMRRLLTFLVGREFRVRVAKNGREGLEMLRQEPPDLILTDVMMPEMSGTELCAAVKGDPETASLPVILVTSKAEREMKIEGLELGADDYVTKPFHPRELMARVRSLVRLRRLQEELAIRNALLESTNEELKSTLLELKEAGAQLVQAERLAAVGELAAGIAHEVNNPVNFATNALTTLQTYVDDVRRVVAELIGFDSSDLSQLPARLSKLEALQRELDFEELSEALAELIGIVTEGLQRTHRLVGELRDFAAPGEKSRTQLDLDKGIHSTIQLLNYALRQAGVEVSVEVTGELPSMIGDTRALNQVFLNLLKNATEALADRGGQIRVAVNGTVEGVTISVADDGPGISEEDQARLFEPFFSTKAAGEGTGLGLSISRRIVQEHGGDIQVQSAPGSGATFTVWLPSGRDRAA